MPLCGPPIATGLLNDLSPVVVDKDPRRIAKTQVTVKAIVCVFDGTFSSVSRKFVTSSDISMVVALVVSCRSFMASDSSMAVALVVSCRFFTVSDSRSTSARRCRRPEMSGQACDEGIDLASNISDVGRADVRAVDKRLPPPPTETHSPTPLFRPAAQRQRVRRESGSTTSASKSPRSRSGYSED